MELTMVPIVKKIWDWLEKVTMVAMGLPNQVASQEDIMKNERAKEGGGVYCIIFS
jgi:hypothetical protein